MSLVGQSPGTPEMFASWTKRWPWSATRMRPDELLTVVGHRGAGSGFHSRSLGLAFGCARLAALVRRRAARRDRGRAAGSAPRRACRRPAPQAVRRVFLDLALVVVGEVAGVVLGRAVR